MTDIVAEVKETIEVDKEVEKSEIKDEVVAKKGETEKNGDAVEEKTENGSEASDKSVENGDVKENGISEKEKEEEKEKDSPSKESSEVCGIKRKSEVGLESEEAPVESTEKKQKVEETAEPEVAANGC